MSDETQPLTFTAQLVRQQFAPLCREILFAAGYTRASNPNVSDDLLQAMYDFEAFINGHPYTLPQKDTTHESD